MQKPYPMPEEILNAAAEGVNLRGKTFGEQFDDGIQTSTNLTLLVFLRHLGCIFCRENVKDLRDLAARNPSYPKILFVYQGTVADGEEFFGKFWKEARAIADLPKRFYYGFDLQRGGFTQLLGPAVWARGIQAAAKGNFIGRPVGDVLVLSGYFLIRDKQVIWEYRSEHTGDRPDFERLPEECSAAVSEVHQ